MGSRQHATCTREMQRRTSAHAGRNPPSVSCHSSAARNAFRLLRRRRLTMGGRRRGTTGRGGRSRVPGTGGHRTMRALLVKEDSCMKLKLTAAIAITSVALAPAAFSQEQTEVSGFYVGGAIGQFNAQIDDV